MMRFFLFIILSIYASFNILAQNNERIEQAKKVIEQQFKGKVTYNRIYEHDRGFYSDLWFEKGVYVLNIGADYKEFNKTLVYQFTEKAYDYLLSSFPNFIFTKLEPTADGNAEIGFTYDGKNYNFIANKEGIKEIKK